METKQYVKKIVSLNPDKWEYIELDKAIERYSNYAFNSGRSMYFSIVEYKTFKNWLKTEI